MNLSTKRALRRTAMDSAGSIKLGLFKSVRCEIKDVSQGGARLVLDAPAELPDTFKLSSPDFKAARPCSVRWRKELEVGVEFAA